METNPAPEGTVKKERDYFLPVSILLAGLMVSGALFFVAAGDKKGSDAGGEAAVNKALEEKARAVEPRDVILGDPKAPITLIEYGDYQCPACGYFFTAAEGRLRETFIKEGKLRMVFRNFQFLGPESYAAAEAAECAKDQNKFWAYHDALYTAETKDGEEHNGNLNRELFLRLAGNLKLDADAFTSCLDGKKYAEQIKGDTAAAQSIGVRVTPTLFLNGQKIEGALPFDRLEPIVENLLK